jgi:hypothetical protein
MSEKSDGTAAIFSVTWLLIAFLLLVITYIFKLDFLGIWVTLLIPTVGAFLMVRLNSHLEKKKH